MFFFMFDNGPANPDWLVPPKTAQMTLCSSWSESRESLAGTCSDFTISSWKDLFSWVVCG